MTFTLVLFFKQGPSCWEDVLIPDRITGVCQSRNCNGEVAVSDCQNVMTIKKQHETLREIKYKDQVALCCIF